MMTIEGLNPQEFEQFKMEIRNQIDEYLSRIEDFKCSLSGLSGTRKKEFNKELKGMVTGVQTMETLFAELPETVYIQ